MNFVTGPSGNFHDAWGLRIFAIGMLGNELFFDEPINWIAADILGTMVIQLYDGDELFHTSPAFGIPFDERFGGIISDRPFDHVRIFDDADFLTVLDDLHFGPRLPAPAAFIPLGFALLLPSRRRT